MAASVNTRRAAAARRPASSLGAASLVSVDPAPSKGATVISPSTIQL